MGGAGSNKTFLPLRPGQHTALAAAEPPVAMPRYPIIRGIPQPFWHPSQRCQPGPGSAQTPGNFKCRIGTRKQPIAVQQHHRVERFLIQPETGQYLLPGFGLQRRKTKPSLMVALKYPLHGSIAQVANSVEQYYRKI